MNAQETRLRLIAELEAQFSKASKSPSIQFAPEEPVITFPSPVFDKPKMFMTNQPDDLAEKVNESLNIVKGIGFKNTIKSLESQDCEAEQEIYSMKELINKNPENMKTLSYDEKVVKTQLALVKKKEWQDILFDDIDWFKNIDLLACIKKIFNKFYK